jgi:hypothetical protein
LTTLNSFYASANALSNLDQRRWALGAAYRLGEYTRFGYSIAAARALVLATPQYANGLSAAGLTAAYNAVDDVGSAAITAVTLSGTDWAQAPSSAGLQSAVDLRVQASLNNWASGAAQKLLGKWNTGTGGYLLQIDATGTVTFAINSSGVQVFTTSAALGLANGATKWVRATWNAATGQAIVYTSDDGSAWTQAQAFSGTVAAISNNAEAVTVGADAAGAQPVVGRIFRATLLSSIGGSTVGDFNPAAVTRTATRTPGTYTDPQSNVWTMNGAGWDWT